MRAKRILPAGSAVLLLGAMGLVLTAGSSLAVAQEAKRLAPELPYVPQAAERSTRRFAPTLHVHVSPKIELVMLAASRADHERNVNPPQADNHLGRFWSNASRQFGFHEAPQHLRQLRVHGLWGDALLELALHLSEPPGLERVLPWPESLLRVARAENAADPAAALDGLRVELQDFATKLRFGDRYREKRADYDVIEATLQEHVAELDPLRSNRSFWGLEPGGDYYLIPSPLVAGGYLASVSVGERTDHFLAFGPALPRVIGNEALLHHLLHHELSHPLVDPVLRERAVQLESSAALWGPLAQHLEGKPSILTWSDGVAEHLLRAYNIHLLRATDPVLAELSVTSEEENGFIYTRAFLEILSEYAGQRDRWPSLVAFFPTLVERLDALATRVSELNPSTRTPGFDLENPGFEEGGGAWMLKQWRVVRAGDIPAAGDLEAILGSGEPVLASVARDSDVAHQGRASLRLQVAPTTTALVAVEQGPLAIRPGGTLQLSGWVRAADVERQGLQQQVCGLYVLFQDRTGNVLSRGETDSAIGTLDWTPLSGEFNAPAGTVRATVGILLGMSGTAWFDDLKLELLD